MSTANAEKLKALKLTIDKIDKDYGKGSVMMMNERSQEPQEVISTGSIGLDTALGIGGYQKEESLKYMDQNLQVKQQLLFM
jgi:recombination protein RecA